MRKIFIADAHLRRPDDDNYCQLLRFLREIEGDTDSLFIMGDLFEFWIGYPDPPFTHYFPLLRALERLVSSGTRIVYFEGNHDFHMGPYFRERLRADVYPGPAVLELDGLKTYLCHGDQINRKDLGYLLLRFVMHNAAARALAPHVPVRPVMALAETMGRMSRKGHGKHRKKWDFVAMLRNFSEGRFREGCEAVVTGHFHTPLLERSDDGSKTILSLGDWITHFTYGELTEGRFLLKRHVG